jgi:4-amino-4-deoxy-L-arabinose transferase-like glycosyltransferase
LQDVGGRSRLVSGIVDSAGTGGRADPGMSAIRSLCWTQISGIDVSLRHRTESLLARGRGSLPIVRVVLVSLLPALLAMPYLAPRLAGLDRLVTVDERDWLGASANFYSALVHGDFARTSQVEHGLVHPGVMTMWAGALGLRLAFPEFPHKHPQHIQRLNDTHDVLRELGYSPLALLVTTRTVKLLLQVIFLTIGIWLMRPVFGTAITVVGMLLLAFDPFLIAHDRLLHIDGLLALSGFVSMLALLRALQSRHNGGVLALSGVFAAFAWLTRTPGVVLAAVVALVFGAVTWNRYHRRGASPAHTVLQFAQPVTWWCVAALLTTVVTWPALWVTPIDTYRQVLAGSLQMARAGHDFGTFFYGTTYHGVQSLAFAFYYPVSLLWRLTPVTLVGAILVLVGIVFRSHTLVPKRVRGPLAILSGYALLYLIGMSLGAKKFDHYLLPVYPVLDLLAAVGIVGAVRSFRIGQARMRPVLACALVAGALVGQLASALSAAPYYLPYFNPLLGGAAGASRALLVGWGEGMDQVADFILSQPDGAHAAVATSLTSTTLLYFMPESVTVTSPLREEEIASVEAWESTDYYVAYVSQGQRSAFPRLFTYLSQYEPVHTVTIDGVDFARTYDLRTIPPPDWQLS